MNDIPNEARDPNTKPPYISDRAYSLLKPTVQIVLPATGSLYFGMAMIWGLPAAEEVVGSISLLATFFGVILGISTQNYKKAGDYLDGDMVIKKVQDGKKIYSLELYNDTDLLADKDAVIFSVVKEPPDIDLT